ncbi:MAG: hypothetical protein ABI923_04495 [bacterium]
MPDSSSGPYVTVAALCEKTIEDKLGRLSLINIVDQINISPPQGTPAPEQMPQVSIQLVVVVSLKAGILTGQQNLKLTVVRPEGERGPSVTTPVLFQGDERGTNLITNLGLQFEKEGLYWIDIEVADQLVSRIPLRVLYQRVVFG